jgi:hypothetical protein
MRRRFASLKLSPSGVPTASDPLTCYSFPLFSFFAFGTYVVYINIHIYFNIC